MNGPVDHIPVMVDEVVGMLVRCPGGTYLDGTVGLGGHAAALLAAAGPRSRLLGVDLDAGCIARSAERLKKYAARVRLLRADYEDLAELAAGYGWAPADGVLLDLGLSSHLLEASGRGFSFQKDEPLDMRFDTAEKRRAEDVLAGESQARLVQIFRDYGEEPLAARLARAIVAHRAVQPFRSTADLRALVERVAGRADVNKTLARVFQAVRIAVNDEMEKLGRALPRLVDILRPGGRLAVISFHSLEDRAVKTTFRRLSGECVCPPRLPVCGCRPETKLRLVSGAVRPGREEVEANPRARSAVLRVAERVSEAGNDGQAQGRGA